MIESREEQIKCALRSVGERMYQREQLYFEIEAARMEVQKAQMKLSQLETDLDALPDLEYTIELQNALVMIGAYFKGDDLMLTKLSLQMPA